MQRGCFQDIEKSHLRAAKVINGITWDKTAKDILRIAKRDATSHLYTRQRMIFMKNWHLQRLPYRISELFVKCKNTQLQLRSGTKFNVPWYRTEAGRHSIHYRGQWRWNTLREDEKEKTAESLKRLIWLGREHLDKRITFGKGTGQKSSNRKDFLYF